MWWLCITQQDSYSETFFPQRHRLFFCWPLFSLIKGIQFPSVAWWYLVPDTSGSVMSSEREERSSWMQKKEGEACAHCQCLPSWCMTFKHSFIAAAHCSRGCAWIWLWLSCQTLSLEPTLMHVLHWLWLGNFVLWSCPAAAHTPAEDHSPCHW